jgi:diketogulonate reductase-like aldo/keto reductase
MELKQLGRTRVRVPEIGMGTAYDRGGVGPLQRGIECGATLIDTAEIYGKEEIVGQAVAGRRESVFLATKVAGNHLRYDEVLRAAEGSLKRLDVDIIDLYQIHWPGDGTVPTTETARALEALVDRGLVRFIGVCNFAVADMRRIQAATANHPIVSNQVLYNLGARENEAELLPYCQEHGVTIMAYSPLGLGKLAKRPWLRRGRAIETLVQISKEAGKTQAQVALNWCTSHENVIAIPKSNSAKRVEENCRASGWKLSTSQIARLDEAFSGG